jgi:hypothetical protein
MLELVIRLAQGTERRNIDAILRVHAIDADEKHAHRETIEGNGALALWGRRSARRRLRLGDSRARSKSGSGGGSEESEKVPTDDAGFKCLGGYCHRGSSSIGPVCGYLLSPGGCARIYGASWTVSVTAPAVMAPATRGTIEYRRVLSYGTFWYRMQEAYRETNEDSIPRHDAAEFRDVDARSCAERGVLGIYGTGLRARQHA